ncbi:ankyrin repeat and SOCS box protein 12a isoform X1 [Ctenopharyngodon idella]|uniref:ankyrin repeat and SOCS box protein 12a isoform X1 n=1 Tax=Ctenopharyngodon idella TaxID=7959 RepID=UPI0022325480|nr:ankyrin repeat and SOCS box protein 12a isoform X1 [Ctenopharyngodon idella]
MTIYCWLSYCHKNATGSALISRVVGVSQVPRYAWLRPKVHVSPLHAHSDVTSEFVGHQDAAFFPPAGHLRCLQLLLAHGADVDPLDVKAQTPLFTAVCGRYLSCVLALLRAGANPNGSHLNNSSPVLTAAREGDPEILRQLLQHGAEVNARSKVTLWASGVAVCSGPLYLSAIYGHLDCFKMLLLFGADPNYNSPEEKVIGRATQQKTVLELCLRHGCGVEYIQLLIDFGANVYLPTLIIEKSTKQNEAVELLLKERGCPKTLASQCRLAIRRHLIQVNKINSLDSLEIPPRLINYLKHKSMSSALVY